jgi:hypothetical protein
MRCGPPRKRPAAIRAFHCKLPHSRCSLKAFSAAAPNALALSEHCSLAAAAAPFVNQCSAMQCTAAAPSRLRLQHVRCHRPHGLQHGSHLQQLCKDDKNICCCVKGKIMARSSPSSQPNLLMVRNSTPPTNHTAVIQQLPGVLQQRMSLPSCRRPQVHQQNIMLLLLIELCRLSV